MKNMAKKQDVQTQEHLKISLKREKNNVLRCYFAGVRDCYEVGGIAVLAYNSKDAKRFAWNEWPSPDLEYIDLRVLLKKDVNFNKIPKEHQVEGHVLELQEGYQSGAYYDVDGDICESLPCEIGYPEECGDCPVLELKKERGDYDA
jgi:hypothetical protein